MAHRDQSGLGFFEVSRAQVEPAIRALRLANVALDFMFYDVPAFRAALARNGLDVEFGGPAARASSMARALQDVDLSALSNPEGAILVVDAARRPYVRPFDDVKTFLDSDDGMGSTDSISVSGVGSSALGSAAFAWDLSVAFSKPIAAIVPGYGLADVVQQALGGWFGFEMYSYWIKKPVQDALARMMPAAATVGRQLLATAPDHDEASTGVPVFRRGSGSSDVLHAMIESSDRITSLFGHSKGALVIENAILGLSPGKAERLNVMTFGCAIAERTRVGAYQQFLGVIDGLGLLNSAGNKVEYPVLAWHSTNTAMPLIMNVTHLAREVSGRSTQPSHSI
jgi:hypothetical protein